MRPVILSHDCLETGNDGHGLECAKHPERPEGGEGAEVDGDGHVGHGDHREVEPVPGVPQVRERVEDEAAGKQLDGRLVRVDCGEDDFSGRCVPILQGDISSSFC